jgi:putative transposase
VPAPTSRLYKYAKCHGWIVENLVHLMRNSIRYMASGDMKEAVAMLKQIYQSASAEEAQRELDAFEAAWGQKYRSVVRMWRDNWANIIPFFSFHRSCGR